ncbi:MAG: anti-phage ZorAB system protein ZorA [Bdellovibrionota bacterium]
MDFGVGSLNLTLAAILGVLIAAFLSLIFYFCISYLFPSYKLSRKLCHVTKALAQLKEQADKDNKFVDPIIVSNQIMTMEPFKHLWAEYVDTLHSQCEVLNGQEKVVNFRETAPAEMFFSTQVLVDTPLRTEFFKHLPGLFTGIGIIGTFSGLIVGLQAFEVSEEASKVHKSLDELLRSVSHAFMVSGAAIFAAMVVTFFEKRALSRHYDQVEKLCQLIDSLYQSGAGEEYLARLVKASEESATQTTQLKDSLVADIKELMTNLVDRQIQATQASHQAMSEHIAQSITTNLREPMEAVSRIVSRASQNQSEAVQKTLSDIIAGFMSRLDEVFGNQIAGLNALMQETSASMRDTRDQFAALIANLSSVSREAGEAMSEQLIHAMEATELRQREMNGQMRQFVEQIHELVLNSQVETSGKLNITLETLGTKVSQIIDNLAEQHSKASQETSMQQKAIADHAQAVVSDLGGQTDLIIAQASEMAQAMKDSCNALRDITTESINKMNAGAETLHVAASKFSDAGKSVVGVFERANQVAERLSITATGIDAAAKTAQLAVASYDRTRADLAAMLESLQAIIESARREAGLSKELIHELETAAIKFKAVQNETEDYLGNVSGILTETFSKWTDAIQHSLNRSRTEFDKSLQQAVEMLRTTIEDLEEGLSEVSRRK